MSLDDRTVSVEPPQDGEATPDAPPAEKPAHSSRLRGFTQALVMVLAAAAMLIWLFVHADNVSPQEHQAYSRELSDIQQTDMWLYANVLATRFGVNKNYDDISLGINDVGAKLANLQRTPGFLLESDASLLAEKIEELGALAQRRNTLIEKFVRESAILRNSTRYFPTAIRRSLQLSEGLPIRTKINSLSRDVMTYMVSGDEELAQAVRTRIASLRNASATLPAHFAATLTNALDHGLIMIEHKTSVDTLLNQIAALDTKTACERLIQTYNAGYVHASAQAQAYRVMLFVVALVLAFYLVLIFIRLDRATRDLKDSNRKLEERIDELHRAQANLKLYATVFTSAAEGMVITDARARILVANPAFTTITGYGLEEIRSRPPSLLSSGRHAPTFYHDMWKALERRGKWQGEIWNRRRNGEVFPEWLSITAVHDREGEVTHYIGVFSDVTERKRTEAHIQHLSHHDPLTNLPNRLLMQERMSEAIAQSQRVGCHTAVLFMNLDRFRNINDTLGSELGDALLQQVAHRSQSLLRDTDTVSRLGGDEFVFILPDINQPQDVAGIARKLLASIGRPYLLGEHDITITASIGIALSDTDGATAAELLRNADAAMSRAKEDGRNNFRFYSTDMNTSTLGDLLLENQLRAAVEHNELELFYQPKVCAQTGRLESAEALLRWRHPEQGMLQPGRFIRLAEESGLIVPIGEWVLRTACRQVHDWREAGLPTVPIAVNLSAQQFLQNDLPVLVRESLDAAHLEPAMLELELTESMLMSNIERIVDMLTRLREMGVSLSIDDFGTGYSSLSYLKQFDVNVLKIDKSFVDDIHGTDADGKIAVAVIGLAHALGLKVVAEGVETETQRDFLLAHGCDIFQGYLFSRPIPAAEFALKLGELQKTTQPA
ncbi:MAG: EAL domain-containing protein [Azoarcus sp.]|jgi:diguanylate cyclase (GGDEF)-like protein/PAS domain S-box-containing protein|nr:EAL domain-containing protein [Azoarcus sp.]